MATTIFLAGGATQVVNAVIGADTAKEIAGKSFLGISREANQPHPEYNKYDNGIVPDKVKESHKQMLKEAKSAYRAEMRKHIGKDWRKTGLINVPGRLSGHN